MARPSSPIALSQRLPERPVRVLQAHAKDGRTGNLPAKTGVAFGASSLEKSGDLEYSVSPGCGE